MEKSMVVIMVFLCSITLVISHAASKFQHNLDIIGGHHVSIHKVPFMASLRINGTFHYCGASIIHERFLVSAAHCIKPKKLYKIVVGTDHISQEGEMYDIEKIIVHKNYSHVTQDYDICLIKLAKNLTFGPNVNKTALADKKVILKKNIMVDSTGWGSTGLNDSISNDLLQVKIPIISTKKCRIIYFSHFYNITPRMICAGAIGRDSCQGDSGGPLTLNKMQVGVTSFGIGCGKNPGIYTKISSVLPWITDTLKQNS